MSYVITTNFTGEVGVNPRNVRVISTDNLATITAAGYLPATGTNALFPTDLVEMRYGMTSVNPPSTDGTFELFTVSISNATATLIAWANPGDVVIPTVANNIAHATGTTGQLSTNPANVINRGNIQAGQSGTAGSLVSYPSTAATGSLAVTGVSNSGDTQTTISNASMGQATTISIPDPGASTANFIVSSILNGGIGATQNITTGNLAVTNGSMQVGSNGHAGNYTSYPNSSNAGSLVVTASATSGNHTITLTNAAIAQATTFTLPDPGVSSSNVAVTSAALVSGNLVKASGTAGVIVDAGFSVLAKTTSAYAGGGTSNAFTATGLTSSSIVTASILTSTNSVSITKVVPSSNTLTITFSADPGANTTVSYHAITPAV